MTKGTWGGSRPGAGRKPTGLNTVTIHLTLTKNEAQALKERAKNSGMTISRFAAKWLCLNAG